ncbi:MAG: group III truncated hemoglobin [Sandaracinaceae bacterium]
MTTFPPDEAEIAGFVRAFYGRVQHHPELGPVFARRIEDWEPHLARMTAFWTAVLHGVPAYTPSPRGGPPVLHRAIEELSRAHFDAWLTLFRETLVERLGEDRAEPVMQRARRMARALSAHLPREAPPSRPGGDASA